MNPLPELDALSVRVFDFFLLPSVQSLWTVSEWAGERRYISRSDLEVEARVRGVELTEEFLDKFAECERVVRDRDAERAKERQSKPEKSRG